MIKFRCPSCQTKLGVPDEYANRRVKCNHCGQPCIVPKPIAEVPAQPSSEQGSKSTVSVVNNQPAKIQLQRAPQPQSTDQLEFIDDSQIEIQEDPNAAILRQLQKEKAAVKKISCASAKPARQAPVKAGKRERGGSDFSLTEIVPDVLHFPLSLVLGLLAMAAFIGIWIVAAQKTQNPLTFFTMLMPWAAAAGIRLLAVNRTFALGTLAAIMGIAGIGLGRVVVAKTVMVPLLHKQANQEVLKEIPKFLSDPKLQIPQEVSAKSYIQDSGFMTCIAIIAAVDQDNVENVIARQIAMGILQETDKSLIEKVSEAGTAPHYEEMTPEDEEKMMQTVKELEENKDNPEALKKIMEQKESEKPALTEEQLKQQKVMEKVDSYLYSWFDDKSAALSAARKYYPVLSPLRLQSKLITVLQEPQQAFHFALLMTLGLLDVAWLLAGFCGAYVLAAFDL